MKKTKFLLNLFAFTLCLLIPLSSLTAGAAPSIVPTTTYAERFLSACEEQQWFIDAVEGILQKNQKTLESITSADDLKVVKSLGISKNQITGYIPKAIGELKELRYLFLSGNRLSGSIPEALFTLPKLQNIDLSNNEYTGEVPQKFGTMKALTYLNLRGNQYTGSIPDSILENTSISYFDISSNRLNGKMPENLAHMTALEYLAISDNGWTKGELPELSSLKKLKVLSAWKCQLTGELPDSLYDMPSLRVLDLGENSFSGEISEKIANLTDLRQLSFTKNQLRGTIPASISQLENLTAIDLSGNFLRGVLPDAGWKQKKLYVENNYLTGEALQEVSGNSGNFADDLQNGQYQLEASRLTVQISQTDTTNLYELLENERSFGGSQEKPLLRPDEYTLVFDAEKISCVVNDKGILIKALEDIPESENCFVALQIKGNTGSEASTVKIKVTTKPVRSPSVSTGGGSSEEPEAEFHKAYVSGYPDGKFRPENHVTREEATKMVVAALELESYSPASASFPDVSLNRWSFKWIETAAQLGYLKGYKDGTFGPEKPITRAEMASILVRIISNDKTLLNAEIKDFSDVPDGKWYTDSVRLAAGYGLINGYPDGTFRPEQKLTRTEAVTMINHMLSRDYKTAEELHGKACPFPDVSAYFWGYGDIMEASVEHDH